MSIKGRLKLIQRIAQTQPGAISVSGSPTSVDVAALFPGVIRAWGSDNLAKIQQIVNIINMAIYVLGGSQMDFNTLRLQYFNVDMSKYPDQVLTAIIRLAKVLYDTMLTHHIKERSVALSPEEKQQIIMQIQRMLNVSTIPDGGINAFLSTKVGNLKEKINGILITIR